MKRILIIAPNWIGDMLMAQPLLRLLKTQLPTSHLTVLAPHWVAPVLSYMREVDSVISTQLAHGSMQIAKRWHLAKTLKNQFDSCYILPNSWKSALLPWLAHIPERIGYIGEMRYGLLTQYLANPSKSSRPPMVAHYAQLAQNHSANIMTTGYGRPELTLASNEIAKVAQIFDIDADRPLLVFCPGAEFGPAKRWPSLYFSELAQLALSHFPGLQIIALGSQKDYALAQEIKHIRNLCGTTRLDQAIALLARADAIVCNDSGLMHISAALDRPQIAIFGSSSPHHTPPNSNKAAPVWLHLTCSPCYQRVCPLGHLRCLYDISPQKIMSMLKTIL